jgi:Transposase domain (DUF772)
VVPGNLAEAPGRPFYRRLNEVLDQASFDEFCEARCRKFCHENLGRPSLCFWMMLIGFFEGIKSERGIAWRVADSLCLRQFLQIGLDEPATPRLGSPRLSYASCSFALSKVARSLANLLGLYLAIWLMRLPFLSSILFS